MGRVVLLVQDIALMFSAHMFTVHNITPYFLSHAEIYHVLIDLLQIFKLVLVTSIHTICIRFRFRLEVISSPDSEEKMD